MTHDGGQDPHIAGGRQRPKRRGGVQGEEYLRGHLPPLETPVWPARRERGQADEGIGAREC